MRSTPTDRNTDPQPPSDAGARTNPRDKTAATRLSFDELEEIESASKRSGKSLAEWIRDTLLWEARQRPNGPLEQILAEISASSVLSAQIAQQVRQTTEKVPKLVGDSADQSLKRIEAGVVTAVRSATVSEVGAKIDRALATRKESIEGAQRKLAETAERVERAGEFRWNSFIKIFRWQQLAIVASIGIGIGILGTWYFVSRPLNKATDYILHQKDTPVLPPNVPQSTPSASHHPTRNQKPKNVQGTQPQTESAPVMQPPQ